MKMINVRNLNRRSVGSRSEGGEGGTLFEPFNSGLHEHVFVESRSNWRIGHLLCIRIIPRISRKDVWKFHTIPF